MRLDLRRPIVGLDGKEVTAEGDVAAYAAKILAESNNHERSIKLFEIAQKLFQDGSIEVDIEDYDLLEKTIKSSKNYANIVVAQILLAMKEGKCDERTGGEAPPRNG